MKTRGYALIEILIIFFVLFILALVVCVIGGRKRTPRPADANDANTVQAESRQPPLY